MFPDTLTMDDDTENDRSHEVMERLKEHVTSVMNSRNQYHSALNEYQESDPAIRDLISAQKLSPSAQLSACVRYGAVPSMLSERLGYCDSGDSGSPSPVTSQSPGANHHCETGSPIADNDAHAPWNYEEQFKQLYEIDDNPKRREFLDDLFRFMHSRGTPINRLPIMAKQVLDLYELFNLVVARGGLVEVINKKLWQEIIKGLKLPSSITSAAFTLRTQYMKYLYTYECHKKNLSSPSELQVAIDGNRREGRRSAYSGQNYPNDFMHRSSMMSSHLHNPNYMINNGIASQHHLQNYSPLTSISSGLHLPPISNGTPASLHHSGLTQHPLPPSSPFFQSLTANSMMTNPNDALLSTLQLWNYYSKQQNCASPPLTQADSGGGTENCDSGSITEPQTEALNLEVRRQSYSEMNLATDNGLIKEEEMNESLDSQFSRPNLKNENILYDKPHHTKVRITSKGDSSMVVSMDFDGITYQGVLFPKN